MSTAKSHDATRNLADLLEDLGGIDPSRVRLKRPLGLATEADLIEMNLVWEVAPRSRTVAVYEAPEGPTVLKVGQVLDGGPVLPGFALPLLNLFADLDRQGA